MELFQHVRGPAKALVPLLITLLTGLTAPAKTISDSLVEGLDCTTLSRATVLRRVRPTAFAAAQHLPVQNWNANLLGQCWSLAATQRRFFYLARTGAPAAPVTEKLVNYTLNLTRGTVARNCEPAVDHFEAAPCGEDPTPLKVFTVAEPTIGGSELFRRMEAGVTRPVLRDFRSDIERGQRNKFYDLSHLDLVIDPGSQLDRARNAETLRRLIDGVNRGRMPLVILRFSVTAQHAVLVKGIRQVGKDSKDSFDLLIYDSNNPGVDRGVFYDQGYFHIQDRARLKGIPSLLLGATIVDEDDMDAIESALFAHYRGLCAR